ncbi:MAG: hypothetical protein CM15mP14_4180 [Rhodospirillaceae bacterium]|nr:MAG: hypothetical protein CM15mP14_4180 [Rhodospirillaceae bacterium]
MEDGPPGPWSPKPGRDFGYQDITKWQIFLGVSDIRETKKSLKGGIRKSAGPKSQEGRVAVVNKKTDHPARREHKIFQYST